MYGEKLSIVDGDLHVKDNYHLEVSSGRIFTFLVNINLNDIKFLNPPCRNRFLFFFSLKLILIQQKKIFA